MLIFQDFVIKPIWGCQRGLMSASNGLNEELKEALSKCQESMAKTDKTIIAILDKIEGMERQN